MIRISKPPATPPARTVPTGPGISKLDAARRQLSTAIRLYFQDDDPISTHTLAKAASEIIHVLCKRKGSPGMRDQFLDRIDPRQRKNIVDLLNKASNFFKHGSRDPPLQNFNDEMNFVTILMAVDGLRIIGEELPEAVVFSTWVSIVNPGLVASPPPAAVIEFLFGNIAKEPRNMQKQAGLDAIPIVRRNWSPKR